MTHHPRPLHIPHYSIAGFGSARIFFIETDTPRWGMLRYNVSKLTSDPIA